MKPLACSLFLILIGVAVHAQVRETTTVEVVEVPVYVSANCAPVAALTRDNFELFINGKRQPIEYFDSIDYDVLSPAPHDYRQRRLFMLVFDLLSPASSLSHAQKAALEFIDRAGANDSIGVATFRSRAGLHIVIPFSGDKFAVRRAVRELDLSRVNDPLHLAVIPAEGGAWAGRFTDPAVDPALLDPTAQIIEIARDEVAALTDLADRLARMEGQRHVVLLSSGFEGIALHGLHEPRAPGDVRMGPIESMAELNRSTAPMLALPDRALTRELDGLHAAYAAAGVFLDAIDIGGLRYFQTALSNESLYELVTGTGGEIIDRRNNIPAALQLLSDLDRVVYILGFRAGNTGRTENRIRVRLINVPRGTHAAYRSSYQSIADQPDNGDMLRLADIIQNDIPQNGVTTNVAAVAAPNGAKIAVTLPGRELLAHQAGDTVGAKVMIYVMSGTSVVGFRIKRIDIDVPRAGSALLDSPVRVSDSFDLPPGGYAAKVLVRMDVTGALGFARADFNVTP